MANFKQAFALTLRAEGGYANDPDDKGGLTYCGITSRDWPNWGGWPAVKAAMKTYQNTKAIDRILAANLTLQAQVQSFYKTYYWDIHRLDLCSNQYIAEELFDSSVNCGVKTAGKWLQTALNQSCGLTLPVDGIVGPATLLACNGCENLVDVYNAQNQLQRAHYLGLVAKNPVYKKFLNSWLSRVKLRASV